MDIEDQKGKSELNVRQAVLHIVRAKFKPIVSAITHASNSAELSFEEHAVGDFFGMTLNQGSPVKLTTPEGVLQLAEDNRSLRRKSIDLTEQLQRAQVALSEERMKRAKAEAECARAQAQSIRGNIPASNINVNGQSANTHVNNSFNSEPELCLYLPGSSGFDKTKSNSVTEKSILPSTTTPMSCTSDSPAATIDSNSSDKSSPVRHFDC
jgi:hypothetical protein